MVQPILERFSKYKMFLRSRPYMCRHYQWSLASLSVTSQEKKLVSLISETSFTFC